LVISAVVVDHSRLTAVTHAFIDLKRTFSPGLAMRRGYEFFDALLDEMKGTDIRRDVISPRRRESRRAIRFLDQFVELLEYHKVRIFGRVWIKQLRYRMDGNAVFTSSIQAIFRCFQEQLEAEKDHGIVIADSRTPGQNVPVAHSIFTQKFRFAGDPYNRILEMPTFGHSNNHVGLQIADILASALLFPMSAFAYCSGHVNNVHVNPGFRILRDRYGPRLQQLQFRYANRDGRNAGGITVSDALGKKNGSHLFADRTAIPSPSITLVPPIVAVRAPIAGTNVTIHSTETTTFAPPPSPVPPPPQTLP
jgi:hypothetical protein